MQVIAHRGSNREATENTRAAFEKAVLDGSDRIELDLQITKDHKVIIFHDAEIEHQRINSLKLNEVLEIFKTNNTELLTLDEVLGEFASRIELNLEIKPEHSKIPNILLNKLQNKNNKPVIISSFYPQPLKECSELGVAAKTAFLWEDESADRFDKNGFIQIMQDLGCNIFHPHCDMVDEAMITLAKQHNWLVYPWVPMAGEQQPEVLWGKLFHLGVDGLCTNLPKELKSWVKDQV